MCLILDDLKKYCPSLSIETTLNLPDGGAVSHKQVKVYETGIGGDQLTCERIRGAQGLRKNHDNTTDQLRGFVPFIEDWHTRMTLLTVCVFNFSVFFSNSISSYRQTLHIYQDFHILVFTCISQKPFMYVLVH